MKLWHLAHAVTLRAQLLQKLTKPAHPAHKFLGAAPATLCRPTSQIPKTDRVEIGHDFLDALQGVANAAAGSIAVRRPALNPLPRRDRNVGGARQLFMGEVKDFLMGFPSSQMTAIRSAYLLTMLWQERCYLDWRRRTRNGRDSIAGREDLTRDVGALAWIPIDFQLAIDEVHDPVLRDAAASVHSSLPRSVKFETGIGDLRNENSTLRMMISIIAERAVDHRHVGLRFGIVKKGQGRLHTDIVAGGEDGPKRLLDGAHGGDVGSALRRHFYDVSLDELYPGVGCERSRCHGPLILLTSPPLSANTHLLGPR